MKCERQQSTYSTNITQVLKWVKFTNKQIKNTKQNKKPGNYVNTSPNL